MLLLNALDTLALSGPPLAQGAADANTVAEGVWPAVKHLCGQIWDSGNVGAFATAVVGFVALYAIRANRKQTRDNILKGLVDSYVALKKLEAEAYAATAKQDAALAKELQERFYQGLIDLLWMEYQLWRRRSLDNALFWTWTENRKTMYDANATVNGVQFRTVWDTYKATAFPQNAPKSKFLAIMDHVFAHGSTGVRKWNGLSSRFLDTLFFWERRWLKGV